MFNLQFLMDGDQDRMRDMCRHIMNDYDTDITVSDARSISMKNAHFRGMKWRNVGAQPANRVPARLRLRLCEAVAR